jgi:hypothetical protein
MQDSKHFDERQKHRSIECLKLGNKQNWELIQSKGLEQPAGTNLRIYFCNGNRREIAAFIAILGKISPGQAN